MIAKKTSEFPVATEADFSIIQDLYDRGILTSRARQRAMALMVPSSLAWKTWADRMLLFLGAALILSGVVFFFAYNWAEMGRFLKFFLVDAGLFGCLALAWIKGTDTVPGQMGLFGATVLVGVFLAIIGQTYPTGAELYQLFLGWFVLVSGWVVYSKFAGLWVFWVILLNLLFHFYCEQLPRQGFYLSEQLYYMMTALINVPILMAREFAVDTGVTWARGRWHRHMLWIACLYPLLINVFSALYGGFHQSIIPVIGTLLYLLIALGGSWFFSAVHPDVSALTISFLSIDIVLIGTIARILQGLPGEALFLLLGAITIGIFSGTAFFLKNFKAERGNTDD
jgi:uncharacterized membrane protein